ncbi:MAG TPA: ABC transporter substrate-binding protein [Magnetospirillaceae bacterium]|jgi:NitT/TauT family transport system substrate-binding protein
MTMISKARKAILAAAIGVAAMAGSSAAFALDKVTFGTDWVAEGEHGGYYQAKAAGIYEKYGLDVTIVPGGPQVNNPQLVASGTVDVVLLTALQAIRFAKEGVPLVGVAAMYQKNPQIFMAHKSQGFKSLADLKGHPIMVSSFARDAFWPWMKLKFGYTDEQIRPYTFNLAPFLHDPTVIQQGYITNEPFTAAAEGSDPQSFLFADEGYKDYAHLISVRRDTLENRRDVLQRFINASIEGWQQFLYGDPSKAFELIRQVNPEMKAESLVHSREALRDNGIIDSGDAKTLGIGAMTDARWKQLFDEMVKAGMYPADVNYKASYDLSLIDKKFGIKQ